MKIRIQGNTIRLRLNDREVQELDKGETLVSETWLPEGSLRFELSSGLENQVVSTTKSIAINVESDTLESWATSDEITIALSFDTPQDKNLSILVEKDMKV